jgi:hypothetical protein
VPNPHNPIELAESFWVNLIIAFEALETAVRRHPRGLARLALFLGGIVIYWHWLATAIDSPTNFLALLCISLALITVGSWPIFVRLVNSDTVDVLDTSN